MTNARHTLKRIHLAHGRLALVLGLLWSFILLTPLRIVQAVSVLENPLKFDKLDQLVAALLQIVVMVSLPIISLIIVYSGFLFLTAQGDVKKLQTAKNNILYALIGAVLVLGAWALAELLGNTIDQLRG